MPNSVQHFIYQIFFVIEGGGKSSSMSEDVSSVCGSSSNISPPIFVTTPPWLKLEEGMVEWMHEDNIQSKMDRVQVVYLM